MKRLVFCFDGTWNRLDAPHPTNVVIVAESVIPMASKNVAQFIYYDEGIGTSKYDRFTGGVFGSGMVEKLGDAYRALIFNHTPGDEIYIFGFSRGAYTARSFAGLLSTCGILRRSDASKVNQAIENYQERKTNSAPFVEKMMCFRRDYSPDVVVSDAEDAWRREHMPSYNEGPKHRLRITYLGVWDTVGALGIPTQYKYLSFLFNRKYQFHDTSLSGFVRSARHAVAIDERRRDFQPTLWDNIVELNESVGAKVDAGDAPYQQKWFPGTHGSVGGGGERRGLSDQTLDWILDGARQAGLELDGALHSRIYELAPRYTEFLANTPAKPTLFDRLMRKADRRPGPKELFEVGLAARRRWLSAPEHLEERVSYRPPTLDNVAPALNALDPVALGVNSNVDVGPFDLYLVKPGDTLSDIASKTYGDPKAYPRIFAANLDKLESPNRIYAGQSIRIPRVVVAPT